MASRAGAGGGDAGVGLVEAAAAGRLRSRAPQLGQLKRPSASGVASNDDLHFGHCMGLAEVEIETTRRREYSPESLGSPGRVP
jgi:hypothetical protein